MLKKYTCLAIGVALILSSPAFAAGFKFESIPDLTAMTSYLKQGAPLGSPRDSVREIFVNQGGATLTSHPTNPAIEKYIYDINLCSYYVWRWNISADYDAAGKLTQIYMNGNPVFAEGAQVIVQDKKSPSAKIYKMATPRPLASKGEASLASIVFDGDGNTATIDDQEVMGGGPSRPDPADMGKMVIYKVGPLWRSIFDIDPAKTVVNYAGDCSAADVIVEKQKAAAK